MMRSCVVRENRRRGGMSGWHEEPAPRTASVDCGTSCPAGLAGR
jgi:hypothetical protein